MRLLGRSEREIAEMDWREKSDMATIHAFVTTGEQQMFAQLIAAQLAKIILPLLAVRR